jgi:membrane peptidoglycan carboxypeptidase
VPTTPKPRKRATAKAPAKAPAPRRHWLRWTILGVLVAAALVVGVFAVLVARTTVPSPNEVATSEATVVYYADGTTEIGRLSEATRRSVDLADVPVDVQRAVLAAEDRDFYEHGGVSPVGIARALWNNVTGGSTQGGSTITQQYAKNAFLSQERSWDRKIQEALLAFKLETVVSKDEILENYLNTIYFGRGAYGIEAAAIAYFGVPASDLTAEQGAVLASIIKSPSGLAPEADLPGLRARWAYVMDAMVEEGWLTQRARDRARFPEITEQKARDRLGGQVGFMLTMVQDQLLALGFDETELQRGGLRITSTFERRAQRAAQAAVRKQGPQTGTDGLRIGLAAVRPGTGEIVAVYGGRNFVDDQINNATRPFAQAGSTFKAFALAAATEREVPLTSVWNGNSPATVNGYTFSNYGDRSYGEVTLLQATENSINSAYVEMESTIGVDAVADAALRAGIPDTTPGLNLDGLDLTFVLGTASPSALDVANAYATFAARGSRATTTVISKVVGPNGGLLYEHAPRAEAAFGSDTADTVSYALSRVVTDGTGAAAQALGRPAAGKTGTTDDNKSAWFVGYTPQLAAAVLMAKEAPDGTPVSMAGTGGLSTVTGGSFPAAIWTAFMSAALANLPEEGFPDPPGVVLEPPDCPTVVSEPLASVEPGCPTPIVAPEFTNDPADIVPVDPATEPPVIPSQSPDAGVLPTEEPQPTEPPSEPIEEGRPE